MNQKQIAKQKQQASNNSSSRFGFHSARANKQTSKQTIAKSYAQQQKQQSVQVAK